MSPKPLSEYAEIRHGNVLVIRSCMGKHRCGGYLRIPFSPGVNGVPGAVAEGKCVWKKVSGDSTKDLTLQPSCDFGECGHFYITDGMIHA